MSLYLVAILAKIAAEQARLAGMLAQNEQRTMAGYSPAYTEADFLRCADELERLGESARMLGSS